MRIHLAILALATSLLAQEPRGFDVDTLAPGVYAFVRREPVAFGMESNSLLVVGARYAAVVEAQLTLTDTREVIAAVRRITSLPVRYVVNTHCHDDHVTGNPAYAEAFPGVDFVASREMAAEFGDVCARNRASFRKSGASTPAFLRGLVTKGESLIGGPIADDERLAHLSYARLIEQFAAEAPEHALAPTLLFDDSISLDLGGRRIDVMHLGRGHSRGDSLPATRQSVNLSEFRTLFGGDSKLRLGLFDNYVTASAIPAELSAQKARRP